MLGLSSATGTYGAATLNTDQVIDNLLRCTAGQIVACNVLAGVEHRLIDRAWVKETLAWMGRLGAHADYGTPEKLADALRDLRAGTVSEGIDLQDEPPDIRLRGDKTPRPFQVDVTCVVPTHVLRSILSLGGGGGSIGAVYRGGEPRGGHSGVGRRDAAHPAGLGDHHAPRRISP